MLVAERGYPLRALLEAAQEMLFTALVSVLSDRLTTRKEKWLDSDGEPTFLASGSSFFGEHVAGFMYGSISVSKVKNNHADHEEDN